MGKESKVIQMPDPQERYPRKPGGGRGRVLEFKERGTDDNDGEDLNYEFENQAGATEEEVQKAKKIIYDFIRQKQGEGIVVEKASLKRSIVKGFFDLEIKYKEKGLWSRSRIHYEVVY